MSARELSPAPLERALADVADVDLEPHAPLAPWTSVRVGGAAEVLARPRRVAGLVALLARAEAEGAPVQVLGGGANTLVGDGGVAGVTVKLPGDLAPPPST